MKTYSSSKVAEGKEDKFEGLMDECSEMNVEKVVKEKRRDLGGS
jgi:hypothetical protein